MYKSILFSLFLIIFPAQWVVAEQPSINVKNADPIYALFAKAVSSPTVPGISVAIADQDGLQYVLSLGYSNIENNVPLTAKTKMRIGSIAKTIATAGLMRLYDQGKIDLDAPIRKYVSQWPEKHADLTLRHLTAHISGVRHYKDDEFLSNKNYHSSIEALNIFNNDPLIFPPGSEYRYSTYAWTLVSAAMETAANGKTFKQVIRDQVFTPLNLEDITFDDPQPLISNRVSPYSVSNGVILNAQPVNSSYKYAGGGFLATPSDVAKFAIAHSKEGYLKTSTLKEMFTPATLNNGIKVRHGIGWAIGFGDITLKYTDDPDLTEINERIKRHPNAVMHWGDSIGGSSMMILCLDHKHSIVVVKNVNGDKSADLFKLSLTALDLFKNKVK